MANTFLKSTQIASTAIGLLNRELVVARTTWNDAISANAFTGAFGDTVSLRVPSIGQPARTRTLRAGTEITNDSLAESKVDVKLDTDVYKGVTISDEELSLDIVNFGAQVLAPQTQAVAEGIEDAIITKIAAADFEDDITISVADPYGAAVDANEFLNARNVPRSNRFLLVGSEVESAFLMSDRFKASGIGDGLAASAFQEAVLGSIAGFTVVGSNGIDANKAYAYHRTAFPVGSFAPAVPDGAASGERIAYQGIAMRWLMDYDYVNASDRSLVSSWIGVGVTLDSDRATTPADELKRAVELTLAAS